jgi:predicted nucleotidyltransferase
VSIGAEADRPGDTHAQPTARARELREVASRIVTALPAVVEEVVLTGSVSRGVADELSDIEMLFVTTERLELTDCFGHIERAGHVELDTWGVQGTDVSRVFGYYEGVPVETTWWPREFADATVAALVSGEPSAAAEALAGGIALRTRGLLDAWQQRLGVYPEALAAARIEAAALTWGGFHPTGFLTLARPGERLALVEYLYNDAVRVLRIVYALNRAWQPTSKRLADRVQALAVKPDRLAERIEEALTEPDPLRAMLVMSELQVDTVDLAPRGPNVDRARRWLREVVAVLREAGG